MPQPDDAELLRRLERAMSKLPQTTREVFLARLVAGLSYAEIAALTGLSKWRVERHMASAVSRLARLVDDEPLHWWQRLFRWRPGPRSVPSARRGEGAAFETERRVREVRARLLNGE
jgi:DNA-binding CsgD family transcriptional regulator